jgi:hypothetical protein
MIEVKGAHGPRNIKNLPDLIIVDDLDDYQPTQEQVDEWHRIVCDNPHPLIQQWPDSINPPRN